MLDSNGLRLVCDRGERRAASRFVRSGSVRRQSRGAAEGADGGISRPDRTEIDVKRMKVLVTGSNGLIGSEAVEHFDRQGHEIVGVDHNMRRPFFGAARAPLWNLGRPKGVNNQL